MQLVKLRVFHFRNLDQQEILLSPGINVVCGSNGQGKTNLLEAVYFLGYGKSFRTAKPRECIRHGESDCAVEGTVTHNNVERSLQVTVGASEKKLTVSGKPMPVDEFVGLFHVTAFTSEHLSVVRGGPGERRAFLDRAMVTLFPGHLRLLASYGRAVRQRNKLLCSWSETGQRVDEALLDSWDEVIARDGARIVSNRLRYVERLKAELLAGLFGAEVLKIHYVSTIPSHNAKDIEAEFGARLRAGRAADCRSGITSIGPHRDDLKLYADGKSVAVYGSAGQQRSCLLALYFTQMEIHRKEHGFYPVLLVDDVEAELDNHRLKTLVGYLSERTQTFLTTAKVPLLHTLSGPVRRYEVSGGSVLPG